MTKLKKGKLFISTKPIQDIPEGTVFCVEKGGKNPVIICQDTRVPNQYLRVSAFFPILEHKLEPYEFKSEVPVINELVFKVKEHKEFSQETIALSGHVIFRGERIEARNEGYGGCTDFFNQKAADAFNAELKAFFKKHYPSVDDCYLDLEMVLSWYLETKCLMDFTTYLKD